MVSIVSIMLLLSFLLATFTQFTYSRSKNFLLSGTTTTLQSVHFSQNIVAFKQVQANYRVVSVQFSETLTQIKAYNNSLSSSDVLRSAESNQIGSSTQFITFTGNSAIKRIDNFTQILSFYNCTANLTVVQSFFGLTLDSFVVLVKNYSQNLYSLLYIENTTILNETRLLLNISTSFLKYQKSGSYCTFLFETEIFIFQFLNSSSKIQLVKSIRLPYAASNHSISLNSSILAYSIGSMAHIVAIKQLIYEVDAVQIGQSISDLNVAYPYCLISSSDRLYQYDLEIQKIVSVFNKSFGVGVDYKFEILQNKILIFYKQHPLNNSLLYIYTFGNKTFCNGSCINCQNTYRLDPNTSSCVKDSFLPIQQYPSFILNLTNTSQNNISNISSFSILNSSNNTNATFNSSYIENVSNSSGDSNENQILIIQDQEKVIEGQIFKEILQILGKSFTFASFRLTPKFLLSLTFFVEELQAYKVHQFNYSEPVQFFMEKAQLINQVKLSDWILQISDYLQNDTIAVEENNFYFNFQSKVIKSISQIFFLNSIQQFYKISITTSLVIYLGAKLLHLLVYLINRKVNNTLLKAIDDYFSQKSHPIFLLVFIIQSNLPNLAFSCFLQIKYIFQKRFYHSVNHLLCFTTLFLVIIYAFALFPLGYSCRNKRSARHFITRSKNKVASYFSESFCLMGRVVMKNFIHSFFYDCYSTQIVLIVASDIICFLVMLVFRKTFINFGMVIFMFIYNLIFLCLNTSFVLEQRMRQILDVTSINNIHFTLLISLMTASIIISLIVLSKETADVKKKIFLCFRQSFGCKNKIVDQKIVRFSEQIHMGRCKTRKKVHIPQIKREKDYLDSKATTVLKRQHWVARTSREISLAQGISSFSCMSVNAQKNLVLIENCLRKPGQSLKGTIKIKRTKTNKYELQMKSKQVKCKTQKNLKK